MLLYIALGDIAWQNIKQFRRDNSSRFEVKNESTSSTSEEPSDNDSDISGNADKTTPIPVIGLRQAVLPLCFNSFHSEMRVKAVTAILTWLEMLSNYYARIPDSTILDHRFVWYKLFHFFIVH